MGDRINYSRIPPLVMKGMKGYVEQHNQPGSFLTAVIQNNLKEAIGRADEDSYNALRDIVAWFYNESPSCCWGNCQKMLEWLTREQK